MSFRCNPFEHLELFHNGENDKGETLWNWYCYHCGDCGKAPLSLTMASTLYASFKRHLWSSHGKLPEDFEGWSTNKIRSWMNRDESTSS